MERHKSMLVEAIRNSDIIPPKQKNTLEVLCLSEYPLTAKSIEKELGLSTPQVHFSLQSLLKRNFVIREKDGKFLYRANYSRIEELIKRHEKDKQKIT